DRDHRDLGLAVPRLARGVLPAEAAAAAVAGALCRVLRDGREQQRVLPAARARDVREVAGAHAAGLPLGGEGQPLPHPHQAAARTRGAGRPPDGPRRGPRAPAGHDPAAAAADPEGRSGAAARVPGAVPGGHPRRRRTAARELVDRRDPGAVGALRRRAVLGRPRREAGRPALAHRRLGLPAFPPRLRGVALPPGDAAAVGRPAGRDMGAGGGRARLLQQRPRVRGDHRRRPLRRRRPPGRGDADPRPHRRSSTRPGVGRGTEDAGRPGL
ncbi:MAG: FIG003003: hypothetical protein, partial [uncultured Blastococcus sp.]